MVLFCRNNATINAHVKLKTGSNTGSDTDPWPDLTKIADSVKTSSAHVLQPYLPDQTDIPYRLRARPHNMTMTNKTKFLNDSNFIIRMRKLALTQCHT